MPTPLCRHTPCVLRAGTDSGLGWCADFIGQWAWTPRVCAGLQCTSAHVPGVHPLGFLLLPGRQPHVAITSASTAATPPPFAVPLSVLPLPFTLARRCASPRPTVHRPRWSVFIDAVVQTVSSGRKFDSAAQARVTQALVAWEEAWVNNASNTAASFGTVPVGSTVEVAQAVCQQYSMGAC